MFGYRHGKGAIVVNGQHIGETHQCVHCGKHWEVIRGSGRKRGYCILCKGVTCGHEACNICVPFEAWLEFQEGNINAVNRKYYEDYLRAEAIRNNKALPPVKKSEGGILLP